MGGGTGTGGEEYVTKTGKVLTDADVQALADEAEEDWVKLSVATVAAQRAEIERLRAALQAIFDAQAYVRDMPMAEYLKVGNDPLWDAIRAARFPNE